MVDPIFTPLETAFRMCLQDGVAPGDFAQRALELAHSVPARPCGLGAHQIRVTTIDEATGKIDQKVIGSSGTHALVLGPNYELAAQQRYGGGTIQLMVRRRKGRQRG